MPDIFPKPIDATTKYCAVYGHPVAHSASPAMHNAAIAEVGLNWRYLAFDVIPEQLQEAITGVKVMHFVGLNLTVPHKLLAMSIVDELDETAKLYGAVNTIRFDVMDNSGEWVPIGLMKGDLSFTTESKIRSVGFNTDAFAITQSLKEDLGFEPSGAEVLLVGIGGAGRVAALRLAEAGVRTLYLANRTRSKAIEVANTIKEKYPTVNVIVGFPQNTVDLVLNATSLGLKSGDPLPIEENFFDLKKAGAVYDMIYRPAETPLLKIARAKGCRVANGLGMLLWQGARAFEIWTGLRAPVQVMREALERNIYGGD